MNFDEYINMYKFESFNAGEMAKGGMNKVFKSASKHPIKLKHKSFGEFYVAPMPYITAFANGILHNSGVVEPIVFDSETGEAICLPDRAESTADMLATLYFIANFEAVLDMDCPIAIASSIGSLIYCFNSLPEEQKEQELIELRKLKEESEVLNQKKLIGRVFYD